MDIFKNINSKSSSIILDDTVIRTITMHTTGEPTRIIISGYPELKGRTLLEKRQYAKANYDIIRRRLMHEPRGHRDMYGAILVAETEFTGSGEADIGVLFMHNEGYSTMCGHATIALGRFLIDTHDLALFPLRNSLKFDPIAGTTLLRLHAPCGIVKVSVPTKLINIDGDAVEQSDSEKPVSFLSVPSFAAALDLQALIPKELDWRDESQSNVPISFDIAYGGAFYVIVSASELGYPDLQKTPDTDAFGTIRGYHYDPITVKQLDSATKVLKSYVKKTYDHLIKHPGRDLNPELRDLEFLYGVIVVDNNIEDLNKESQSIRKIEGVDVNITFFASQQLDRSPTGSGVSARIALSIAKRELRLEETRAYHSVVSIGVLEDGGGSSKDMHEGVFLGSGAEEISLGSGESEKIGVIVRVEGKAWYISMDTFVLEKGDIISKDAFLI